MGSAAAKGVLYARVRLRVLVSNSFEAFPQDP
jgi:hypothetical protein